MILETRKVSTQYTRISKLKKSHTYTRVKTLVSIQCDSCGSVFDREQGTMDPKRLDNRYYHVCSNCDVKKFAQSKGVEKRRFWELPVNSDLDITRF